MGGYERDPDAVERSTAFPPTSTASSSPRTGALPADHGGRDPAGPGDGGRWRQPGDQRSRGASRRTTSSSWANRRSAGSSWPPGSAPTASPARAGSGARWPAGSWTASRSWTCGRWTSGGSAPRIGRSAYTLARADRELRDLLRHPLPERGAPGRPPAADCRRPTSCWRTSARRSERSPAGSGPTGSSPTPPAGDDVPPAARLGRDALVAGHRRRGARHRGRRPGCSTRARSPSSRSAAPAPRRSCQWMCANDIDRAVGADRVHPAPEPTRRDPGGSHGHAARRGPLPARDRHGVRQPRCGLAPSAPARGRLGRPA